MTQPCAREGLEVGPPARRNYRVTLTSIADGIDAGAAEMFARHWAELETNSGDAELEVDWPRFFESEKLGWTRSFGLWCGEELVGYSLFFTYPHIHSRTKIQATCDVLYVKPEHRGSAGVRLVRTAERALAALGVWRVVYNTKVQTATGRRGNTTGDLLRRMGYQHDEEVFTKLL